MAMKATAPGLALRCCGVVDAHRGELGASLGRFGRLRMALDQLAKLVDAGFALALLDAEQTPCGAVLPEPSGFR